MENTDVTRKYPHIYFFSYNISEVYRPDYHFESGNIYRYIWKRSGRNWWAGGSHRISVWHLLFEIHYLIIEVRHLFAGIHQRSLYLSIFLYAIVKKCSNSRSFCHLHLSVLGVDRCCKRQTLFKCQKAKQSAQNAQKPLVFVRKPHLFSRPLARATALQASHL